MSSDHGKLDVAPTESKTTRTVGNFPRGSRETPETSVSREADRSEKARCRKSDVYVSGESDSSIVPKKPANNDGPKASAELVEGRGLTEENASRRYRAGHSAGNPDRVGGWAYEQRRRRSADRSSTSEVGAVCGSSARTDLREGRPARAGPIAVIASLMKSGLRKRCGQPPAGEKGDSHQILGGPVKLRCMQAASGPRIQYKTASPHRFDKASHARNFVFHDRP